MCERESVIACVRTDFAAQFGEVAGIYLKEDGPSVPSRVARVGGTEASAALISHVECADHTPAGDDVIEFRHLDFGAQ